MRLLLGVVAIATLAILGGVNSSIASSHAESIMDAHREELALFQTPNGELVDVFIELVGNNTSQLDSASVDYAYWGEGLYSARVPFSQACELGGLSTISRVRFCRRLYQNLNASAAYIKADRVHSLPPTGYTGRGVLIGIIDLGLDVTSLDLKNYLGKTRVLYLWDHTRTGTPPSGFNYGSEFDSASINSGVYYHIPMAPLDSVGHGTACAGIAAGSGLATGNGVPSGKYKGIAPDADIIAVVLESGISEARVGNAVNYIINKAHALNRPCVINLSLGLSNGPRDGTDNLDLHVNNMVLYNGPPTYKSLAIVVAAGNDGFDPTNSEVANHFSSAPQFYGNHRNHLRVTGNGSVTVNVQSYYGPGYFDEFHVEVFYPKTSSPSFSLTVPAFDSTGVHPVTYGPYSRGQGIGPPGGGYTIVGTGFLGVQNAMWDDVYPNPYAYSYSDLFWVTGADRVSSGTTIELADGDWTITGSNFGSQDAWDVYLYGQKSYNGKVHTLTQYSENYKVAEPGCGADVITVGSINTKNTWQTELNQTVPGAFSAFSQAGFPLYAKTFFSSPGPSRNPDAGTKPEILAPGAWIASTGSAGTDLYNVAWFHADDGVHLVQAGTSFSSPHVAGVIALMMEKNPNITNQEIRAALAKSQMPNGCVDALAAVNAVTNSIDSPPSDDARVPGNFALDQNYPNPFNPNTIIRFSLVDRQGKNASLHARLVILNVLGQEVRTLLDEDRAPGSYQVSWNGRDNSGQAAASGVYFYRLDVNGLSTAKKMLLLK